MMSKIKNELDRRKEELNKHYDKFKKLKEDGKWAEAWEQLIVTLNYANETLKYSSKVLKDMNMNDDVKIEIDNEIEKLDNDLNEKSGLTMIVIPKEPTIH